MIRLIVWTALGYASCVWDSSCSPEHVRWPSATAVFVLLLAMREPRYAIWGAGACGLAMDAAQGGVLGPRVLAGVVIATLASGFRIDHAETSWLRVAVLAFVLSWAWLLAPGLANFRSGAFAVWDQTLVLRAVSTTLVTLALRSLLKPTTHADEAPW